MYPSRAGYVLPPGIKSVKQDKDLEPEINKITDQYSVIFKGIGKIRDIKNGKEFYAKFSMRQEAVPVAQRPRPVACYLQEPLKKCVEEIFKEVPESEAVTRCSPLVVQPKPKFNTVDKEKPEPHMIRASVDLRVPNQFMERNRTTQGPIVEDIMLRFQKFMDKETLLKLYKAFILPHFYYCSSVWHFCGVHNSNKVDNLDKRILRLTVFCKSNAGQMHEFCSLFTRTFQESSCKSLSHNLRPFEQNFPGTKNAFPSTFVTPQNLTINAKCNIDAKCNNF